MMKENNKEKQIKKYNQTEAYFAFFGSVIWLIFNTTDLPPKKWTLC